jgi:AbrB family looped-hinge helix DNA binding protein
MATIICTARVRKDGSLGIPKAAREELGLRQGDEVEVVVQKPIVHHSQQKENPLYHLVGIGKGGPPDGAENHDKYLYGKKSA